MSSSGESAAEPESGDTLLGELMSPQEMMDKTFPRRMVTTILPLMEQLQDREALLFRGIVVGSRMGRAGCALWAEVDVSDSGHGLDGNRGGRTKYMNPAIVKSISVTRTSKVVGGTRCGFCTPRICPMDVSRPRTLGLFTGTSVVRQTSLFLGSRLFVMFGLRSHLMRVCWLEVRTITHCLALTNMVCLTRCLCTSIRQSYCRVAFVAPQV